MGRLSEGGKSEHVRGRQFRAPTSLFPTSILPRFQAKPANMPSEHCVLQDVAYVEQTQPQAQIKLCSSCHCQLSPESISLLHPEVAIVCTTCRERICAHRGLIEHPDRQKDDILQVEHFGSLVVDHDAPMCFRTPTPPPAAPSFPHSLVSPSSPIPILHHRQLCSPPASPSASPDSHDTPPSPSTSLADPRADITRLRVRSHSQGCLFPGAQFSGTQKSGRSSYEVSVTIVVRCHNYNILQLIDCDQDVDFTSSFLCGYLRIRGLTDDWPELTTYFDAQIIGSRYGFLTDDWGANEQEDMTHWARFPAFQKIRQEIRGPRHTIRDRDRDCVFMRWKERFLVPDHRVRDINGASFAGE